MPPGTTWRKALRNGDAVLTFEERFDDGYIWPGSYANGYSPWSRDRSFFDPPALWSPRITSSSGAVMDAFSIDRRVAPAPDVVGRSPALEEHEERSLCDRFVDFFRARPNPVQWVDAGVQGATGGFSPSTVADSVDIAVAAAPSIKAKTDNIKAYSQVYGPLIRTKPKPPQPTLSQRFWRGAARIIFFWD